MRIRRSRAEPSFAESAKLLFIPALHPDEPKVDLEEVLRRAGAQLREQSKTQPAIPFFTPGTREGSDQPIDRDQQVPLLRNVRHALEEIEALLRSSAPNQGEVKELPLEQVEMLKQMRAQLDIMEEVVKMVY